MIIVCNFKSYLPPAKEVALGQKLLDVPRNHELILCPSFLSLQGMSALSRDNIKLGAQNCSSHVMGAFTGEIAAQALAEIGVTHVIIGHSERARYEHETKEDKAAKLHQAIAAGLVPIVCIGESHKGDDEMFIKQLEWLRQHLTSSMIIAYEPVYAIGSGTPVTKEELTKRVMQIRQQMPGLSILYGGSVSSSNYATLGNSGIDGFLLGKSGTDFQELQKMLL